MSKKKGKASSPVADTIPNDDDVITPQYRHIKELSRLKYEAEERREQNLIQQSSQMQTVFSFMTAAIFMAVPICIEHRGKIPLGFFLITVSIIVALLMASLVLASIAQWRWKTKTFPDVEEIKSSVLESPDWRQLTIEYNQMDQWIDLIGKVQAEKARLNQKRVRLIMSSMICLYCSVLALIISYIIGVSILS